MRNEWTGKEIEFLIKNYELDSKATIDKLSARHSRDSIRHKAYSLGLKRNIGGKWTEEEIVLLNETDLKKEDLKSLFPNHSLAAILKKADSLGLLIKKKDEWSEEELSILNENKKKKRKELIDLLPGKTWNQIRYKLTTL